MQEFSQKSWFYSHFVLSRGPRTGPPPGPPPEAGSLLWSKGPSLLPPAAGHGWRAGLASAGSRLGFGLGFGWISACFRLDFGWISAWIWFDSNLDLVWIWLDFDSILIWFDFGLILDFDLI